MVLMRIVFLISFGLAFLADVSCQDLIKVVRKEGARLFGEELVLEERPVDSFSAGDVHADDRFFILRRSDGLPALGFVYATSAPGRFDKFDYFVICDTSCVVKKVNVWIYRSTHGGGIAARKWLGQFNEYSGGQLKYGKDIQAISGATISGNSIVEDIQRVHAVLAGARESGVY